MMDPIVIDPPGFDQRAAWGECNEYVDKCGGLIHDDGEPNWRAAFGADPGVTSCPQCNEYYWAWGVKQRCVKCGFEFIVGWWGDYVDGVRCGRWLAGTSTSPAGEEATARMVAYYARKREQMRGNPYFEFGFNHPVSEVGMHFHAHATDWAHVLSNAGADMYTPSQRVTEQLTRTFVYHRPQGNQPERYERLRSEAGKLAHLIATNTPESREQSVALTKLEEAIFFANAAIARNEEWDGNAMKKPLELTVN